MRGATVLEIAAEFNLSVRQISRILADAARVVRAHTADIVAQKFHQQLERIDRLVRLVEMELQAYEEYMLAVRAARGAGVSLTPVKFDDRPFRVSVMLMERQAKLLGMDRGGGAERDKSPVNWLNDAPIDQVIDYARQLKMNIPTAFDTAGDDAPPTRA